MGPQDSDLANLHRLILNPLQGRVDWITLCWAAVKPILRPPVPAGPGLQCAAVTPCPLTCRGAGACLSPVPPSLGGGP